MTPGPRRDLTMLTAFLATAGLVTLVAIAIGVGTRSEPVAFPPTPSVTSSTMPLPTAPPSSTTATTTTAPPVSTIGQLNIFTPADIEAAVTPKVAFITTFNGSGSGVLVGEDIVATNAHVVWPFRTVGVLFPGDVRRPGRVVGIDPLADLAFVQVSSPRLPAPLTFGTTDDLADGASLFVVGYPAAEDLVPDPTVDAGPFRSVLPWEFSGASWVHSGSAAVGGQSGGALVDEYGRLVGVTTFGSPSDLYSLSVEDVERRLEDLSEDAMTTIDERRPPRAGGRRNLELAFEGPWEQAAFVTWLSAGARSQLSSDAGVAWRALDPFGIELDAAEASLDVLWALATPGVVLAESSGAETASVEVNLPLVALEDPDDGRSLRLGSGQTGFIDVPGDRDWFYLEVTEGDSILRIEVEAQTRVRITLYDRTSHTPIAEVVHERGFFFEDPALVVEGLPAGAYVVTVDDVGAQFGTYRIEVQ